MLEFSDLLEKYMRRIRASASSIAVEIGMSREAVNNWRRGYSMPNKKSYNKVLACAKYLRLDEAEKSKLLTAAGFSESDNSKPGVVGSYWERVITQLKNVKPYPILLLLSQAYTHIRPKKGLIDLLLKQLGFDHQLFELKVLYSPSATEKDYFSYLAKQMNMDEVSDDLSFEFALTEKLQAEKIILLVHGFEKSNPHYAAHLAGVMRGLVEMHHDRLKVVICGGEHLAALKYANGDHSLLNIASNMLAEQSFEDIQQEHTTLSQEQNSLIQEMGGGHPLVNKELVEQFKFNRNSNKEQLTAVIDQLDQLYCDFNWVYQNGDPKQMSDYLQKQDLGIYRPYLQDKTLRKLFWQNLVYKNIENKLQWRSEPIRQYGLRFMMERKA